ncbi:MAG: SufE family protein [Bacteroidales bacterium]|nr:SufE family protein [Bacteroidales bacterium]
MTTQDIQNEIIDEFAVFDDWMDKYEYLIETGNTLEPYDEKNKTPSNLIQGCQSRVWLDAEYKDGKIFFTADSDAIITKGIIALLIRVFSGKTPNEIMKTDLFFIEKIGLRENLSPTRANGLVSMIKNMKTYATAFHAKYEL